MDIPLTDIEQGLLMPLLGRGMLELGNKKNKTGVYKDWFKENGIEHVSVDVNGLDGAVPLDLSQPHSLKDLGVENPFSMVTNFGCTEHIGEQRWVWDNIVQWLCIGGVIVSTTPLPGHWEWHGHMYLKESFPQEFCSQNDFDLERCYVAGKAPRKLLCWRAVKRKYIPFGYVAVPTEHIYINSGI